MKNFQSIAAVQTAKKELRSFIGSFGSVRSTLLESKVLPTSLANFLRTSKKDSEIFNLLLECTPKNASGAYSAANLLELLGRADVLKIGVDVPNFETAVSIASVAMHYRMHKRCIATVGKIQGTIANENTPADLVEKLEKRAKNVKAEAERCIGLAEKINPDALRELQDSEKSAAVRAAA